MAFLSDIFGAGGVANLAGKAMDMVKGFIPDPKEQARVRAEMEKMLAEQDFELQKGQLEINKVEAGSAQWFVAGWRPAVGWCGVGTLILASWPKAVVLTVFWCIQSYHAMKSGALVLPPYPDLGTGDVIMLLSSMLGIGGMRSLEKIKGVETSAVRK